MDTLTVNPTLAEGDLLELSPLRQPNSILKPSQKDNLIMLQTPVHKNLKVSFITPHKTPVQPQAPSSQRPPSSTATALDMNIATSNSTLKMDSLHAETKPDKKTKTSEGSNVEKNQKWDLLRKLDEDLRWKERVEVITKLDHVEHEKFARECILEMILDAVSIAENKNDEKFKSSQNSQPLLPQHSGTETCLHDKTGDKNNTNQIAPNGNTSSVPTQSQILKPESVKNQKMTNSRSRSVSSLSTEKHVFTMGKKAYSFDLDDIPEGNTSLISPIRSKNASTKLNAEDSALSKPVTSEAAKVGSTNFLSLSQSEGVVDNTFPLDSSVFSTPGQSYYTPVTHFSESDFVDGAQVLAQGHFDLDYLEQKTTGDVSNSLRKQSLYLKFDPLLEDISPRRSMILMGRKSDIIDFTGRVTPQPEDNADETVLSPREPDLLCDSPSELNATGNLTFDASCINRGSTNDSVSSVSPVINSANSRPDFGIVEVLKYSEADLQKILKRKREKWKKEKQASDERCNKLREEVDEQSIVSDNFMLACDHHVTVVENEKEKNSKEMKDLQEEKEELDKKMSHMTNLSNLTFKRSEAFQKVVSSLQSNELKITEYTKNLRMKFNASKKNILDLEREIKETMKSNGEERSKFETTFKSQLNNLHARIKSLDLKARNLQKQLDHKQKENNELTNICDELVTTAVG